MNIKQKLVAASAIGAMAVATIMPAASFAAVKIEGNGAGSANGVAKVQVKKKIVKQFSFTAASTGIGTTSNTGDNEAKLNTGPGTVDVKTGKTETTTTVDVSGGSNTNEGGQSCCCDGEQITDTNVVISGNGTLSHNGILLVDYCKNKVVQGNATVAQTVISTSSNTGGNTANGNTGGNVTVDTGNAITTTSVTVSGGSNTNN